MDESGDEGKVRKPEVENSEDDDVDEPDSFNPNKIKIKTEESHTLMSIFKFLGVFVFLAFIYILVKHKILRSRVNRFDMGESVEMSERSEKEGEKNEGVFDSSEWKSADINDSM